MKLFKKIVPGLTVLATAGLLTGCIPAPLGKYYKPLYPDASAKYAGDECYGQAGAPSSLSFVIAEGVTLGVTTNRIYGEKDRKDRPLRMSIGIPTGTRFQFLAKEIRIARSPQDAGTAIAPELDISAAVSMGSHDTVDFSNIAPTPFPSTGTHAAVSHFSASTWLNFSWKDDFVPTAFSMEFPAILLLDSAQADRQPLTLMATAKKRPETYPGQYKAQTSLIYATSSSEAALAEKYSKCLRETPNTKCSNIPLYDEAGFKLEKNGFHYSGRWYVYDVEKHTPFNGEIKIQLDQTARWKFASDQVRILSTAPDAEKTARFDRFPLHFSYQVPLDTPVLGVNNATGSKSTTLSIQSSLGTEELPRYFIILPPVSINGKTYQIAPIELEKRVFDFGLEPFNC